MEYQFKRDCKAESRNERDPRDNIEKLIEGLQTFCTTKSDSTEIIGRRVTLEYEVKENNIIINIESDYASGFVGNYQNKILINTNNSIPKEILGELNKRGYKLKEETIQK
jgi:hypothetical protein